MVITGPDGIAAVGGTYTLRPDGLSDLYDATNARSGIKLDAAGMAAKVTHIVWGSAFADEIHAGATPMNVSAGAGDDVIYFGTGADRVSGGAGNDTFVFAKGLIVAGDQILDVHRLVPAGGEHDLLRFTGFSAAAHLDLKEAAGGLLFYQVVDGASVSPAITIATTDGGLLTKSDYVFA